MSTWSEAERTAIFVMATEYDLEWEEIHEIFGRMFNLDNKRQYQVSHIRDEVRRLNKSLQTRANGNETVQAEIPRWQVENVETDRYW